MHRLRDCAEYRRAEANHQVERYWSEPEFRAHKLARTQAMRALNRGEIQWAACPCGRSDSEMHHEDYSKPLEVKWLCRPCHLLGHNGPDYPETCGDPIAELLQRFDARRQLRRTSADSVEWDFGLRGRVA